MIETITLAVLAGSFAGLVIMVSRKIPVLARLPETSSGKLRLRESLFGFLNKVKGFINPKDFSIEIFLQKLLSRIRVLTLKLENKTANWLQKSRENSRKKKFGENDNYWKEIRTGTNQEDKKAKKRAKPA